MMIKEDVLHYCWRFRKWLTLTLNTTDHELVEVIDVGNYHHDAGPDFVASRLKIGDTLWSGNVEIHLKASDWYKHQHHKDRSYENVILHVVYEADEIVLRADGTPIPTVEVAALIPDSVLTQYSVFTHAQEFFPCYASIHRLDSFYVYSFLQRVMIERLEQKSQAFFDILSSVQNRWEEALYIWIARSFGFKTNALPFELLAKSIPQQLYAKYKSNPLYIEALVFGNAGFLMSDNTEDPYMHNLYEVYQFLKNKHSLQSLEVSVWKFLRMRPSNFPTRRLAQFAAFIIQSQHLFSKILEGTTLDNFRLFFENLPVNVYWENHYRFGQSSKPTSVQLGRSSVENMVSNSVAVFLYAYGKYFSNPGKVDKALNLLEDIKPEKNYITQAYEEAGLKVDSAMQSQALMQLYTAYCQRKKCFSCGIGFKLISS